MEPAKKESFFSGLTKNTLPMNFYKQPPCRRQYDKIRDKENREKGYNFFCHSYKKKPSRL